MNRIVLIMLFTVLSHFAFAQTTDFTYQNTSSNNCLPAEIQFTQTSSGTPRGYLWDFGNGVESNSPNPIVTYTAAGYYTVRLITVYDNSTAQKTRTILISPSISASFTPDRVFMCRPGTINFTATNSGNLGTYVWDFGDGTAPVSGTSNTISHAYTGYGEFTVTLTATSATGCSISRSEVIQIRAPRVSGTITSPKLGCIPMTTTFTASTTLPTGSTVTSYAWDFGDGNLLNTTQPAASHTYEQVGAFSPTLVITTNEGCTGNFRFDSVAFGRPPVNHDAHPLDTVYCGSETPQFIAVASTANRYDWDFGGGHITSVTDTFVEHRYTSLGFKDITVTPLFNGCAGTPENFRIEIIGVIARFSYENTCADKKTFLFDNNTLGHVSTISWNLGNQQYSNSMDTVTATYPTSGVFGVKMLVTDDITGCVDSFKTKIYTADPVMQNPDASICINSVSHFSVTNNYENPSLNYTWYILGDTLGPGMEPAPEITATRLGEFTNTVILDNGSQYCPDTLLLDHTIKVRGPRLDFTAPDEICLSTALNIVNNSAPYQASDSIRNWNWNFGYAGATMDIYQPPPHTFPVSRPYNVKLTATDIFGCQDSLVKRVWARPMPFLWIIPKLDTLCQGESSTLIGYTSDEISWLPVTPGYCTTCDTTTVSPVNSTRYYATATNSYNCAVTDSAFVKVFNPFTANILTADTAVCGGSTVQLEVDPKDKVITWTPAASISNPTIHNPTASPNVSTTFTAALTDSAGCFSSQASMDIRVKTKPTVDAGPDKAYPYAANFTLSPQYSNNIRTWTWSPSDSLSCSDCPSPIGMAGSTKTYSIEVVSDSGCTAKDNITVFVECNGANLLMPGAFTPNNDNLNDYYSPITRGIRSITRFAIFNRQGQLVYEMRDFLPNKEKVGWDGRLRGQPQTGAAYLYVVEAVCDMGQTIFSKGSFLLIR